MKIKRLLGIVVLILAYILLIPGLTQPMLDVNGAVKNTGITKIGKQYIAENENIPKMFKGMATEALERIDTDGEIEVYSRQQSIIGTIEQLFSSGYVLVAMLIGLFSVIVPALKGLMMLVAIASAAGSAMRRFCFRISSLISKWSMADVFVVALMVTYLAANAITDEVLNFQSSFGPGFYYFTGYCLLSIASAQLLSSETPV